MGLWDEPLSEEQKHELIENLANQVMKRGLATPAIMFLEMHKPLTYFASQGAVAFSPFLAPIFGLDKVDLYSQLFADRANVERLIQRIEELTVEQDRLKKEQHNATRE